MTFNSFLKKVLCLLLSSMFLLTLCACGKKSVGTTPTTSAPPTPGVTDTANSAKPSDDGNPQVSDESSAYNDALAAYDKFLAGSMDAQDSKNEISDGADNIKDISLEPDLKTYYALFDMNGDGIPELHLRPIVGGGYAVFTYLDGEIVLWHYGPDYESPLNNGAILYERDGAAPTHINYYYLVLDSDGNEISKVDFSKYHSVDKNGLSESADYDVFMFKNKDVSEAEWDTLTNEYLSNSSDLIIWNEI